MQLTILCGSECWALKGQQEEHVGVKEMRILKWTYSHKRQNGIQNRLYTS